MKAEWDAIVRHANQPVDEGHFELVREEAHGLKAAGRWVSGPSDLMTILGRNRDEVLHSRVMGWLMRPSGQHGLGDAFLRAFMREALLADDIDTRAAEISLEVTRSGLNEATGMLVEARADLVVTTGALVVVVENKVDAGEQPDQCERLYWPWAGEPIETRWVFLSPSGRAPVTASSPAALAAWRPMSYGQVRRALELALDETAERVPAPGRASAIQYLHTLLAQRH